MIPDLLKIAEACSQKCSLLMHDAVCDGKPRGGGAEDLERFFGDHDMQMAVSRVVAPVVVAIDEMLPGFKEWLEATKFGDDRFMLVALLEIANHLAKYKRPSDARIRPDHIPPPKHL